MSADFTSPAVAIQKELDATFLADQTAPAPEAPAGGLLSSSLPTEAGAPISDTPEANPIFNRFSSAMQAQGFQTERLADARAWLDQLPGLGDLTSQKIEHGYVVRDYLDAFEPKDQGLLHNFLNHAARAGWDQSDVNNAVTWYLDWTQESAQGEITDAQLVADDSRAIESQDLADRDQARGKLKEIWQEEFDANRALINRHLDRLPASQRAFYESADDSGTLRLNRPDVLARLAQEARAQVPPVLAEAARQHGSEKAALEHMMQDRSSAYWRGADAAALQARYRDLLRAGDSGEKPLPKGIADINAEINKIEYTMRMDRARYNRDEKMQQRYRELLELRG